MSNNTGSEEFSTTEAYRTISTQVGSQTVLIIVNPDIKGVFRPRWINIFLILKR